MDTSKDTPVLYPIPGEGTRTRRVWEIADAVTRETGHRAARRDVVERFVAENGNPNTANTQYQHWKAAFDAQGRSRETSAGSDPGHVGPQALKVSADGRVAIPPPMRAAMFLGEDGHVTARVVDGELRLVARGTAVRRMQNEARAYKNPGESVVDEFLGDRRAMWGERGERGERDEQANP